MINTTIKRITIENFMSISNRDIDFSDRYNEFVGFNGAGKTTVLSAITWCLFGKDFYNRKQFDIIPIIDGEKRNELKPKVMVEISFNGDDYRIEREYAQTTGAGKQSISVNGLKFKAKDYERFLLEKIQINDEEFKILSNIDYAINLPQNDLKNIIMNLVGEINDRDMFTNKKVEEKFAMLKDKVCTLGTESLKKQLNESRKAKEKESMMTMGAIDQEKKNIDSYSFDEDKVNKMLKRREELYSINENYSKRLTEENNKRIAISNVQKEIKDLKDEISLLEQKFSLKNKEGVQKKKELQFASNADKLKADALKRCDRKIDDVKFMIENIEKRRDYIEDERQALMKVFEEKKSEEIVINDTVCEYCGQSLPKDKIAEMLDRKKKIHDKELHEIVSRIKEKQADIDDFNVKIQEQHNIIVKITKERDETEKTDFSYVANESRDVKMLYSDIEKLREECYKIKDEINEKRYKAAMKEQELILMPQPIVVPSAENRELELKNIETNLANYRALKTHEQNYQELISKKENLDMEIAELIHMQDLLKEYISLKSQIMSKRFQKAFKHISFRTKEPSKSGEMVDCFKVIMDGKTYSTLSGGEKMRASLDLIFGLQTMKGKKLPILIDHIGELDSFPEWIDTQVISCRALKKPNENDPKFIEKMDTFINLQLIKSE